MSKLYCPILSIGFEAPAKGQRDNRTCMMDCAWYNLSEEKCNINVIAERMENIESFTEDILDVTGGMYPYDDYNGFNERTEYFNGATGKRT